jgi:hypothetical protein
VSHAREVEMRLPKCLAIVPVVLSAGSAFAGPACTNEPQSKWLTAEQMTNKFAALGYRDDVKKLHVSSGKCWEIYGHNKDGKKVEVYFHPITAEIMEENIRN